jgi:lysophospholipase L1-like esterase
MIAGMSKIVALSWFVALVLAVACGPYRTEADATLEAGGRLVAASSACDEVIPIDSDVPPPGIDSPTPHLPSGTPTPYQRSSSEEEATQGARLTMTAAPPATATPTPCTPRDSTSTPEATDTPAVVPAITATPAAPTETAVPTATTPPTPMATGTAAAATATAQASGQVAYLSIGDGIQWGCCGALGLSSPSLFRDYLEQRLGRPVIWQTSGTGYHTTDTFLDDGSPEPQMEFALKLIDHYQGDGIPIAAITMSIGGNNLVELGRNCASPPCTDAFVAGLEHLREQLHAIYSRIAAAKAPTTPLLVLLYYDADECADPAGGPAVDAWNAVIAEVASQYGAFLVNARTLFKGHCDWFDANGLDANAAGHAVIAAEYQRVYESLPAQYRVP